MPQHSLKVGQDSSALRLDVFLAKNFPGETTRTHVRKMIDSGLVKVNSKSVKPHHKVMCGDEVSIEDQPKEKEPDELKPENIPLDIFYEDEYLLVVNKPCGMLVHPVHGVNSGTLVNALLGYCNELSNVNAQFRPGIVHRLDRETSGLLIVAKDDRTHVRLSMDFEKRRVKKKYVALVRGKVEHDEGVIDAALGRHHKHFDKKAVSFEEDAKDAKTSYRVLRRFGSSSTLIALFPESGRTHQLRVHMAYIGYPILGDDKYGHNNPFPRLALHAKSIAFRHPMSKSYLEFSTLTPQEFFDCPTPEKFS